MRIRLISGDIIRKRLKETGISQTHLANMIGVHRSHVGHYIAGDQLYNSMKVEKQLKIAEILNIDISGSDNLEKVLDDLNTRKQATEKRLLVLNYNIEKVQKMIKEQKRGEAI